MRVLKEGDKMEHPLDRHYHGLHCKLEPLEHEEEMFQVQDCGRERAFEGEGAFASP